VGIRTRNSTKDQVEQVDTMATYVNLENAQSLQEKLKKPVPRRSIDYSGNMVQQMLAKKTGRKRVLRRDPAYIIDMWLPDAKDGPGCICTKFIHSSQNKVRHPINIVRWTPDGRRVLTASSSGEFTLWNGMSFNFETIMQAHDGPIRALQWSHGGDWVLSGDQEGIVKYWQPNMNNLKVLPAHSEAVRDICFSPSDGKFATACDDSTIKIWDFNEGVEERSLTGHGWDVKCCDWHPVKGLLVSGSKDNLVKLWDPRTAKCLTTLHGHKNTVQKALFQPGEGWMLATCSRDHTTRVFDLRTMRDFKVLRGHERDVSTLTWHPVHHGLISTGGADGSINHYLLDQAVSSTFQLQIEAQRTTPSSSSTQMMPYDTIPYAHESAVWSLQYHPLGHLLCSGSNDRATRFWARPRPFDPDLKRDRYHLGEEAAEALGANEKRRMARQSEALDEAVGLVDQNMPVGLQGGYSRIPANLQNLVPGLGQYIQGMSPDAPPPPPPPGLMPPGINGSMPPPIPPFPLSQLPPGFIPPPPPPGFMPPSLMANQGASIPGLQNMRQ